MAKYFPNRKKYFYSGAFPMGGPPKDLEIKTKTSETIKIFHFIINIETMDIYASQ